MHSDCMHSDCMPCHAHHPHDARQGCKRLPSCRGSKRRGRDAERVGIHGRAACKETHHAHRKYCSGKDHLYSAQSLRRESSILRLVAAAFPGMQTAFVSPSVKVHDTTAGREVIVHERKALGDTLAGLGHRAADCRLHENLQSSAPTPR